jgi:hypothetical protein
MSISCQKLKYILKNRKTINIHIMQKIQRKTTQRKTCITKTQLKKNKLKKNKAKIISSSP